jgi:branched-chain amino acid transport system permease protein
MMQFPIIQLVINGLLLGVVYCIVAIGLGLIFGVTRVTNIAHGEFIMLGAYSTYWVFIFSNRLINPIGGLLIGIPIFLALGVIFRRLTVAPLVGREDITLLSTFGASILLMNLAAFLWTTDFRGVVWISGSIWIGELYVSIPYILTGGLSMFAFVALVLFFKFTYWGKAIFATIDDRTAAALCGINVNRVDDISWALGSVTALVAGAMFSFIQPIYPAMGASLTLLSFCAVVIGGMGKISGALIGGIILGLVQCFSMYFLTAVISQVSVYLALVIVLLIKPGRQI